MKNSLAIIIGFLIVGSLFVGWKISQDLGPAETATAPQPQTESASKEIGSTRQAWRMYLMVLSGKVLNMAMS